MSGALPANDAVPGLAWPGFILPGMPLIQSPSPPPSSSGSDSLPLFVAMGSM